MSKRDYRKRLYKKAVHKAELQARVVAQNNRLWTYENEIKQEKRTRNDLYEDLRNACLEGHYNFKSYIQVPRLNALGQKTNEFDAVLHPLIQRCLDYGYLASLGWMEKRTVAHIINISKRSNFLEDKNYNYFIDGLFSIASWRHCWLKEPDLWKAPDTSYATSESQFKSLVKHLFVKYPMPEFFYKVWIGKPEIEGVFLKANRTLRAKYQQWFINIANGENLRIQKGLPITITKKIAHFVMTTAPSHVSINQAIRWGQVFAMGGDERVASGVIGTPLGEFFDYDEFWQTVIKFFIDNNMLDPLHYQTIYDYICNQKYGQNAPQPNFSMKRREPNTLMMQVLRWHEELNARRIQASTRPPAPLIWESCGIEGYEFKDKNGIYTIKELTTSQELLEEGRDMHHCVSSYGWSCSEKRSAVYSLSYSGEDGSERMATLEISLRDKSLVQARKRFNAVLTPEDFKIVKMWTSKRGISIGRFV